MKIFFLILVFTPGLLAGQKLVATSSRLVFFSDGIVEDITASNAKTSGIMDLSRQEFAFSSPIKEFEFEKSLMKEHFNEKYMESDKYPKATFVGSIRNFNAEATSQDVTAAGKLTIHGVARDVEIPAKMIKTGAGYKVDAKFPVRLADHKIAIPTLLFKNIAEVVEVTAVFEFSPQ